MGTTYVKFMYNTTFISGLLGAVIKKMTYVKFLYFTTFIRCCLVLL